MLGDIDEHFHGDYLNEETILKMARAKDFSTAAIGKLGPTYLFDHTDGGKNALDRDRRFHRRQEWRAAVRRNEGRADQGRPALVTTPRGENGKAGDAKTPGTTTANVAQQAYMADVAAKVVLPMFKARNKPFVLVFWSRDPDGSQHNTGDSLNAITPGINGPTSMAGIKNADNNLAQLRKALDELGLAASTNIIVSSDHGFSTISKESKTSPSAKFSYEDTPKDFLPMGFLAIDLAKALNLPLHDPNDKNARVADNAHPKAGNGVLGKDPAKPDVVVATNGGSDLIYIPSKERKLADRVIKALLEQDYVSGIFVDDEFGNFPGTLPMSRLGLKGKAVTPHPVDRGQFPLLVVRLRGADQLLGANCRHRAAPGPGHAWQLQPRRHPELHGGDRTRLQIGLCRRPARQQCRCRRHRGEDHGADAESQGQTDRPRHDRSHAQRRNAEGLCRHREVETVGERPAHGAQLPARRHAALFRHGGFSRAARSGWKQNGGKQKTAGK